MMPWWIKPVSAVAALSALASLAMGGVGFEVGALFLLLFGLWWATDKLMGK